MIHDCPTGLEPPAAGTRNRRKADVKINTPPNQKGPISEIPKLFVLYNQYLSGIQRISN